MSIIVYSVYYCLTFTNECSAFILNTFKTLLSTDPGILYKNPTWCFLGHRWFENNEWRGIHNDYQTAPNFNISMGLAQLIICYIMEVKTCIKCGAVRFVRRQCLRSRLLSYNLPTPTLFVRQLETVHDFFVIQFEYFTKWYFEWCKNTINNQPVI